MALASSNFDSVRGELRFFAPEGSLTRTMSLYKVYDHLQDRWYVVKYPGKPEVESEQAETDLQGQVDRMGEFNALTQHSDGQWSFSHDPDFFPPLVRYDTIMHFPMVKSISRIPQRLRFANSWVDIPISIRAGLAWPDKVKSSGEVI